MIKLMNDYILVEMEKESKVGGLIAPDLLDVEETTGVIAFHSYAPNNEDSLRKFACITVGDKVRVKKKLNNDFFLNGKKYLLCTISDIIGVLPNDDIL